MYQPKRPSVIEREKRENRKDWLKAIAQALVIIPVLWFLLVIILI